MEEQYNVKRILNKHIPELHDLKSEGDIKEIVDSIVDIIKAVHEKKTGEFYIIIKDILHILKAVGDLSKECQADILKDILEYVIHRWVHATPDEE